MYKQHLKGMISHQFDLVWLAENGYIPFDNIYKIGPVDIIGFRHGTLHLFDVKTERYYSDKVKVARHRCKRIYSKKSEEQKRLGVKFIYVNDQGECKIV
jgi:hypothetical protein